LTTPPLRNKGLSLGRSGVSPGYKELRSGEFDLQGRENLLLAGIGEGKAHDFLVSDFVVLQTQPG
jgi:hypothetical protein